MFSIDKLKYTDSGNFILLAGPCAIESEDIAFRTAEELVRISDKYRIPLIFKGSFKKANRSRLDSFTGIGDLKALQILKKSVPNSPFRPSPTSTPSTMRPWHRSLPTSCRSLLFSRQTDLLVAAARTGRVVNIKKGQFLSGDAMAFAAQKVKETGNERIFLTERGNSFGYQDLIVDYRNLPIMQQTGFPVILDITHSLQQPNQTSGVTGGNPQMIETIARAGIAVGVDGIFMETHPDPAHALSDGANMLPLEKAEHLLSNLVKIRQQIIQLDR